MCDEREIGIIGGKIRLKFSVEVEVFCFANFLELKINIFVVITSLRNQHS